MGWRALTGSLSMTPSCVAQLISWREGMPSGWAGEVGLCKPYELLQGQVQLLHMCQGNPKNKHRLRGERIEKRKDLGRRTYGCRWIRSSMCPDHRHWHTETHPVLGSLPSMGSRGFCPLPQSGEIPSEELLPALGNNNRRMWSC